MKKEIEIEIENFMESIKEFYGDYQYIDYNEIEMSIKEIFENIEEA